MQSSDTNNQNSDEDRVPKHEVVIYARVSSSKQVKDLETQSSYLKSFAIQQGFLGQCSKSSKISGPDSMINKTKRIIKIASRSSRSETDKNRCELPGSPGKSWYWRHPSSGRSFRC